MTSTNGLPVSRRVMNRAGFLAQTARRLLKSQGVKVK